jgi:hypothetical protein
MSAIAPAEQSEQSAAELGESVSRCSSNEEFILNSDSSEVSIGYYFMYEEKDSNHVLTISRLFSYYSNVLVRGSTCVNISTRIFMQLRKRRNLSQRNMKRY